jgi:hypothetical protein
MERNYVLTHPDEIDEVTNINKNPQLSRVRYNPCSNDYEIWTKEIGNEEDVHYFRFGLNHEEIAKVLSKRPNHPTYK